MSAQFYSQSILIFITPGQGSCAERIGVGQQHLADESIGDEWLLEGTRYHCAGVHDGVGSLTALGEKYVWLEIEEGRGRSRSQVI